MDSEQTSIKYLFSKIKHHVTRQLSFMMSHIKLNQFDKQNIPDNPDEIRLFAMMRNESLRLPFFIDYYFSKGVDRMFIIDNGSSDDSVAIALARDNVHVFKTNENFTNYSNWMEILLNKYGKNHWCVAVDLDEVFFYPNAETLSLHDLSNILTNKGDSAVICRFLDMYSDTSIADTVYKPSQDPFSVCPYFDRNFETSEVTRMNQRTFKKYKTIRFSGNMRKRVFNVDANLTKVPFFKYGTDIFVARGIHSIDGANISSIQGVVFHFKYLQDFNNRVVSEAVRGQHQDGAALYKKYASKVEEENNLVLYNEQSLKFINSQQLIDVGLMSNS